MKKGLLSFLITLILFIVAIVIIIVYQVLSKIYCLDPTDYNNKSTTCNPINSTIKTSIYLSYILSLLAIFPLGVFTVVKFIASRFVGPTPTPQLQISVKNNTKQNPNGGRRKKN